MYVRMKPKAALPIDDGMDLPIPPFASVSVILDYIPVPTGILDKDGAMIGRLPDRGPMGFHKPENG